MATVLSGRKRGALHRVRLVGGMLALLLGLLPWGMGRAQQDPIVQLLSSVNGARIAAGLAPYALNSTLGASAQWHSNDMAANDFIDHAGSDGSTAKDRMAAAGYPVYSGGILGTELIYGGVGGPEKPFEWWMNSSVHHDLILSTRYREIGIGMATRAENGRAYWTLHLGGRPNVLPIFLNHGASHTDSQNVVVTLSNEGAMVYGDGSEVIGLASEVRVVNGADVSGAAWQPWSAQLPWVLPAGEGAKLVTVEFRDLAGRTTLSQATIVLSGGLAVPVATASPTAEPSPAPTAPPPPPTYPGTSAPILPTALPSSTPTVEPPTSVVSATHTPQAVVTSPSPLPVVAPATASQTPPLLTDSGPVSQTPARAELSLRWLYLGPDSVLPLVCGLQAVATLLGFAAVARRTGPRKGEESQ
jgi:hypothetical protein